MNPQDAINSLFSDAVSTLNNGLFNDLYTLISALVGLYLLMFCYFKLKSVLSASASDEKKNEDEKQHSSLSSGITRQKVVR